MKIAIFGASGRTGKLLVEQALAQGHEVRAVARTASKLVGVIDLHYESRDADVLDAAAVSRAVKGVDAVLSVVGSGPPLQVRREGTRVFSQGVAHVLAAMREHRVRRLVVTSSAGVIDDPSEKALFRYLLKPLLMRPLYADMEAMELALRQSYDLDWTVVRAPRLTDDAGRGEWRVGAGFLPEGGDRLARADLAAFLLRVVGDAGTHQRFLPVAW